MFRYLLPAFAAGALLATAIFAAREQKSPVRAEVGAKGHAVIHILTANEDGEAVGESVTAALVAFRVEAGELRGSAVLECEQATETRQQGDFSYPVVVLQCGEVKLAVVGLDLTVKK
jgi:hypothetical protein